MQQTGYEWELDKAEPEWRKMIWPKPHVEEIMEQNIELKKEDWMMKCMKGIRNVTDYAK